MRHVKVECSYALPGCEEVAQRDWEMHPSWIAGMEALNSYGHWVSRVVLPIAFQWIEENKPEVYATVREDLKDDVGVVMAAALKLIKERPLYKKELEKGEAYAAAVADGTWNPAKTNPVWTGIVEKVRAETEAAFQEQAALLGDTCK